MTLAYFWGQVWPNLAGNVVWTLPVWAWHHTRMRRLLTSEIDEIKREMREHLGIGD